MLTFTVDFSIHSDDIDKPSWRPTNWDEYHRFWTLIWPLTVFKNSKIQIFKNMTGAACWIFTVDFSTHSGDRQTLLVSNRSGHVPHILNVNMTVKPITVTCDSKFQYFEIFQILEIGNHENDDYDLWISYVMYMSVSLGPQRHISVNRSLERLLNAFRSRFRD